MDRAKWIELRRPALRANLRWTRGRLKPGVRLMAVVKANAYGHGAAEVSQLAEKAGAACLGVLDIEEGVELRRSGIRSPILVLSPVLPGRARDAVRHGLETTADSMELLRALDRAAAPGRRQPVHVDVDSGLRRWGVAPAQAPRFLAALKRFPRLELRGLSTHIDYMPGKNAVEAELKLRQFQRLAAWTRARWPRVLCHAANSSILMDFPQWQLDMVRIGNLLYGINPTKRPLPLRNPWRFYARIISLGEVGKGRPIGYASEFVAPRRMMVAALPVGYSDGLTLEPSERWIGLGAGTRYWGMLRGRPVPFIGRCAISHVLVDVSRVPRPRIGEAVLLPVRRTAASPRIPRVYVE
ncbi:MAG: alanine racemase [Elusimicrobia bacterium]|nr:alanine racemase [Elusimicrobiota bacterium]